jgi:predicted component of type VI protein secretion system
MKTLRIDSPFLSKFKNSTPLYIKSEEELAQSIMEEIGNILSTKLKLPGKFQDIKDRDSPYAYGVRDLQSVGISPEELDTFKNHCKVAILSYECRLIDIEINNISFDKDRQILMLNIQCTPKQTEKKFAMKINVL